MNPNSQLNHILLISDLHLDTTRPDLLQAFTTFVATMATRAKALYILGDFFNVWLGDDDDTDLHREISQALLQLSQQGTAVYFIHGNRDFLLGQKFASACGAALIFEPYELEYLGQHYLLLHGDVLCTGDTDYIQFRTLVRNPQWQQEFLQRSLAERREFAAQARTISKNMNSNKAEDIMDANQDAVVSVLLSYPRATLIHGHTHRPAVHEFNLAQTSRQRIVLGDWDVYGWYLQLNADGAHQTRFNLQTGQPVP